MKKGELINQPISAVIAGMGHLDELVIADAGLPIPEMTTRIDLALTGGVPRFLQTLRVVLTELKVETAVVAKEMIDVSPDTYKEVQALLDKSDQQTLRRGRYAPHSQSVAASDLQKKACPSGSTRKMKSRCSTTTGLHNRHQRPKSSARHK